MVKKEKANRESKHLISLERTVVVWHQYYYLTFIWINILFK